jgi:hypothetical protein
MTREERAGRFLKASADLCALATIPGVLALLALGRGDHITRTLVMPLAVASAIVWLIGFGLFASRCWGLPGWPRALAVYHIAGAPAMLINSILVAVGWGLTFVLCRPVILAVGDAAIEVGGAVGLVIAAALMVLPGLAVGWLLVQLDPMSKFKQLGADRLNALAKQLAERSSAPIDPRLLPPSD